jgi:hypothetical protein
MRGRLIEALRASRVDLGGAPVSAIAPYNDVGMTGRFRNGGHPLCPTEIAREADDVAPSLARVPGLARKETAPCPVGWVAHHAWLRSINRGRNDGRSLRALGSMWQKSGRPFEFSLARGAWPSLIFDGINRMRLDAERGQPCGHTLSA